MQIFSTHLWMWLESTWERIKCPLPVGEHGIKRLSVMVFVFVRTLFSMYYACQFLRSLPLRRGSWYSVRLRDAVSCIGDTLCSPEGFAFVLPCLFFSLTFHFSDLIYSIWFVFAYKKAFLLSYNTCDRWQNQFKYNSLSRERIQRYVWLSLLLLLWLSLKC